MEKLLYVVMFVATMVACRSDFGGNKNLTNMKNLPITQEWDKTFPKSVDINHKKVTFTNRFGITLVADLYMPKRVDGLLPCIAVSGPFGAVKEQSSGLYAQEIAKSGFVTLAFDPSFTGESGGEPRYVSSPDINTEDFSAAVDYLSTLPEVDANKIGILGICGWGGIALNAAAVDSRIKATVASTMYNMSRVTQKGYFDQDDSTEKRKAMKISLNSQRTTDFKNQTYQRAGGVVDPLPDDAPQFAKDYHAYYKTPRGYHQRSLNSNEGWNATSALSWLNADLLHFADEIDNAVLIVHGEKAHSRYMGEDAFKMLQGTNKHLYIVPDASHCDLYDQMDKIPFDEIVKFYKNYLK